MPFPCRALSGTGSHLNRTKPLGITAAPFLAPQLDRHSRNEIIQAQGQAVKHYHEFLPAFIWESPTSRVLASPACQTHTLSELLMDKTSRSTG